MKTRIAALVLGVMVLVLATGRVARAGGPLLNPSWTALAAADEDEPPPYQPRTKAKQVETTATPDETPLYKKWWFWALTAAVVGGTVAFGVSTIKPTENPPRACMMGTVACFGDGRPQ